MKRAAPKQVRREIFVLTPEERRTVSFVLVVLMYRLIPGTYVKWKSALLGGAVGAALWELCKWGFLGGAFFLRQVLEHVQHRHLGARRVHEVLRQLQG